jgi:hypothetical protein
MWVGGMGGEINMYRFLVGIVKERGYLEGLGVDGTN